MRSEGRRTSILTRLAAVAALLLPLALAPSAARAQDEDEPRGTLSRPMKTAIHFYEIGDDVQAMDRFMEILTKGDPSERSMANEYINLITHRMNNAGGAGGNPAPTRAGDDAGAAPRRPAAVAEPVSPGGRRAAAAVEPVAAAPAASEAFSGAGKAAPAPAPAILAPAKKSAGGASIVTDEGAPRRPSRRDTIDDDGGAASKPAAKRAQPRAPRGDEMSSSNQALMRKEIKARLRAAQERSLSDLKAIDGVRVAMRENGDPEAIGIPSALLFQTGIAFQRDAARLLDPLTRLVFALGSTQILILPEGTAVGDAKVLDMRRTMGISSALYQAGVAPPRVRVNLLNTQVDIPKSLAGFKGVVIVFHYDQPMTLTVENAVGDELGPPISLGIFPAQIRPTRNQGAIIEFSVCDPPAGLVSWKFQLLQPSRDGAELAPLQEVVGGGPVFHQIFWNGRQNYFGAALAPGRYECVLSALDAKGRQRALHRWIQVLAEEGEGEALLSSGTGSEPAAPEEKVRSNAKKAGAEVASEAVNIEKVTIAAPSDELPGASAKPLVSGVKPAPAKAAAEIAPEAKPAAKPKRKAVRRAARAQKASSSAKGPESPDAVKPAAPSTPGHYALSFNKNTHQLTPSSEDALKKAASDLAADPLATLKVVGHAAADETDSASLASDRAKTVAGVLINRYQVEPKKIAVSSAPGDGPTAEAVLVRSE